MTQADQPSAELLQRFRDGSESAATTLFDRYVDRLIRLARIRLSAKLAQRVDPEDVVLSACRSFFLGARNGRFTLEQNGDLWRLLVQMTLHKLYRQAARHTADRRSFNREQPDQLNPDGVDFINQIADREPMPDEAVAVADELEAVMRQLDATSRRVLEMRLQGELISDIATEISRSERQVRRIMTAIRTTIQQTAGDFSSATEPQEDSSDRVSIGDHLPQVHREAVTRPAIDPAALFYDRQELDFNDYLLQKHLGTGASGKVYRAREKSTGRTVAVKFLRKDVLANDGLVQRFIEEAAMVARFDHAGLVRIHGYGRTPVSGFFLAQDWIDGPNLAQQCAAEKPDWRTAAHWMADAAAAVHHAHERGIIHCDLKPANLLLGRDDRIRITDFGLARRIDDDDPWNGVAGTLGFMAPEQVDPCWGTISPATDVYGIGAVLYALLAGQPPATGDRYADVLTAIVIGTPMPSLRSVREDIPRQLIAIVDRCLAKQPAWRFRSANAVAVVLRAVGEPD